MKKKTFERIDGILDLMEITSVGIENIKEEVRQGDCSEALVDEIEELDEDFGRMVRQINIVTETAVAEQEDEEGEEEEEEEEGEEEEEEEEDDEKDHGS